MIKAKLAPQMSDRARNPGIHRAGAGAFGSAAFSAFCSKSTPHLDVGRFPLAEWCDGATLQRRESNKRHAGFMNGTHGESRGGGTVAGDWWPLAGVGVRAGAGIRVGAGVGSEWGGARVGAGRGRGGRGAWQGRPAGSRQARPP
ncbi:hypothetical protein GCM10010360_35020 [Streptomyces nogalater]